MLLLLSLTAPAHAVDLGVALGAHVKGAEPYIAQSGPAGSVEIAPGRMAAIELGGAWHPDRGREDWTSLTTALVEGYGQGVILTRERWQAHLVGRLTPIHGRLAWGFTSVGGHAGFGYVSTEEDLDAGGRTENNLAFPDAWRESHAALVAGLTGSVRWRLLAVRLRGDWFYYNENLTNGDKQPVLSMWLGGEVVVWPTRLHDRAQPRRLEDIEIEDIDDVPTQGADTGGRGRYELGIDPEGGPVEPIDILDDEDEDDDEDLLFPDREPPSPDDIDLDDDDDQEGDDDEAGGRDDGTGDGEEGD